MGRRFLAAGVTVSALLLASLSSSAASAATRSVSGARADNPTQTLGVATLYATSAPLGPTAARANSSSSTKTDAHAHLFTRNPKMPKTPAGLTTPSVAGTHVVGSQGAATGFNGLSHADQRLAGTGQYVNTQFSLEPPDQGLCVGNGFVLESVNDAFAVYSESGTKLTGTNALNQFYKRSPAINRVTGVAGNFLSDPKCYFDPVGHRFIQTVLELDTPPSNTFPFFSRGAVLIAVSQTSDPTGRWNLYSMDTSDDGLNGTPVHTQCPCLGDQPLLGANRDGVFIDTNEFQNNAEGLFNGGQIYALGRARLESGASSVTFVHLNVGTVPTGDPTLPFWGSLQPSTSINPASNTELLMTGGPEDVFQNNAAVDNRIAVWSLAPTASLNGSSPHLTLRHLVLTSEAYGLPINMSATQKSGPTPLGSAVGEGLETLNGNDSRMNQVVNVGGVLYGAVNTRVFSSHGAPEVGIAYFTVGAFGTPGFLTAGILAQGYVAVDGQNVLFPSIAVNRSGVGAMAFTLSGPDFFPSAAYVGFAFGRTAGAIHISGAGVLPEDGFTGYNAFGAPVPGVARWGDYSAAVSADGAIWMGNEFIPGTPRTALANWGTFITRLPN
jgi:hypothetical protein